MAATAPILTTDIQALAAPHHHHSGNHRPRLVIQDSAWAFHLRPHLPIIPAAAAHPVMGANRTPGLTMANINHTTLGIGITVRPGTVELMGGTTATAMATAVVVIVTVEDIVIRCFRQGIGPGPRLDSIHGLGLAAAQV
jgi:hypothetical protein